MVLILIHAAWTYYDAEGTFGKYRRDVDGYFEEKLDWEALVAKDEERSSGGIWGHILGWSSGVCLAIALCCGVCGVLKQAQPSLKSIANASSDP